MNKPIYVGLLMASLCGGLCGCTAMPAPAAAGAAAAAAEPMTLPRYLGVTTVVRSAHTTIYRSRLRLARHLPMFEPAPPSAVPMALGDPAAMQSPSPAVAAAASIQQAEASAPGKIAALNYLAKVDCSQHPQVEEALLASLCDPIDSVRIAALQTLLKGQERCGTANPCNECGPSCAGGCCTPAIHARLLAMASQQNEQGCPLEPNATARRLARLALGNCHPIDQALPEIPEEVPAPEVLNAVGL